MKKEMKLTVNKDCWVWWSSTSINENKSKKFSLTSHNDLTLQHNDGYEKGIGCSVR
jgi:hypothetical protein